MSPQHRYKTAVLLEQIMETAAWANQSLNLIFVLNANSFLTERRYPGTWSSNPIRSEKIQWPSGIQHIILGIILTNSMQNLYKTDEEHLKQINAMIQSPSVKVHPGDENDQLLQICQDQGSPSFVSSWITISNSYKLHRIFDWAALSNINSYYWRSSSTNWETWISLREGLWGT